MTAFTQSGVSRLYMIFFIKVGSERQKQMMRDCMMIAKLAANACDLVCNTIERKHAKEMKASHVTNNRLNSTQAGLNRKTSNLNSLPTTTISAHRKMEVIDAEIIHDAQYALS